MSVKCSLLFLMLILSANSVVGQFKNVRLGEPGNDSVDVGELTVAVNPRDPANMVAVAVSNNIYYTKDSGVTWLKGDVASLSGASGSPALIAGSKGNFFYFHVPDPTDGTGGYESENPDRILVHKSEDGGVTWSPGEPIGLSDTKDKDQNKEWPAVDAKGNLFIAWTQFDKYGDKDPGCLSNVVFSTSKNGKKWSDPVQISQLPGHCMDDHQTPRAMPAATVDGKVFVAWSQEGRIFLDRSFNGGDTWLTNDITVAEQTSGGRLTIPGHGQVNSRPVLMTDKSKGHYRSSLYVVWADQRGDEKDTDLWFTRSHNYGDHWSSPQRIMVDTTGRHQYHPWMAVDHETGYIYIVYYDQSHSGDLQTAVYLAYSIDGGAAFKNVRISEKSFVPQANTFPGDYINISAHEGIIAPVWMQMDEGKTSVWTTVIRHEDLVEKSDK